MRDSAATYKQELFLQVNSSPKVNVRDAGSVRSIRPLT